MHTIHTVTYSEGNKQIKLYLMTGSTDANNHKSLIINTDNNMHIYVYSYDLF